jgi:hypothetical protein
MFAATSHPFEIQAIAFFLAMVPSASLLAMMFIAAFTCRRSSKRSARRAERALKLLNVL